MNNSTQNSLKRKSVSFLKYSPMEFHPVLSDATTDCKKEIPPLSIKYSGLLSSYDIPPAFKNSQYKNKHVAPLHPAESVLPR